MFVAFLFATAVHARVEFKAMVGDERVQNSEVCFYKTPADFGDVEPLHNFLKNNDVRCLDADKVMEVPVGRFLFFMRNAAKSGVSGTTFISTRVTSPPESYKSMRIILDPAAFIDFDDARADETRYVISDATSNYGTSYYPVFEKTAVVPAGVKLAIVRTIQGVPASIVTLGPLEFGQHVAAPSATTAAGALVPTHVSALQATSGSNDQLEYNASSPPDFTFESAAKNVQPWIAPRYGGGVDNGLLVFAGVPPGRATIALTGDYWESTSRTITVTPASVTVDAEGLTTAPAALVQAEWPAEPPQWTSCDTTIQGAHRNYTISLQQCDPSKTTQCGPPSLSTTAASNAAMAVLRGVPAGSYTAELTSEGLDSARKTFFAAPGKKVTVSFDLFHLAGTVTLGGKPLHAKVKFARGETYTGEDGRYAAVLNRSPRTNNVWITPCGSSSTFFYAPRSEPSENSIFDIALKEDTVKVSARDKATGSAITDAVVHIGVRRTAETENGDLYTHAGRTTAGGPAVFENIQDDFLTVCASAKDYQRNCEQKVLSARPEDNEFTIELDRTSTMRGALVSNRTPWVNTTIFWVNTAGKITERVHLRSDLSFMTQVPHTRDEYVVVVSATQPLFVLRPKIGDEIEVGVPDLIPLVDARFLTEKPVAGNTFATVEVGGAIVPLLAFTTHQMARHAPVMLEPGKDLVVPQIAATGPITAVLGPNVDAMSAMPRDGDVFTAPEWRAVQRKKDLDTAGVARF